MKNDNCDGFSPDLGLACRKAGHAKATFTFTRLIADSIDHVGHGKYSLMCMFPDDQGFAVSIDFDKERLSRLLTFVPADERPALSTVLAMPFMMPISLGLPPGGVPVGVRAKLGKRIRNSNEEYIPFVAVEFLVPAATSLLAMEG